MTAPALREDSFDLDNLRMCDFGAAEFHARKCSGVLFRIMGNEAEKVRRYMAEAHPTVPFFLEVMLPIVAEIGADGP